MRTKNQQLAEITYKLVTAWKKEGKADQQQRYGGMAHNLPALIRSAGLCQALTFVDTRNEEGYKKLLDHIAKTVQGEQSGKEKLLAAARTSELLEYTRLTREVLLALNWFKRFAQSVLETDSTSGESR
jgi:CRISPR-associated protein Cmr5